MPKLGDIATSIELGDGESIVVTFVPSMELVPTPGKQGGTTWHIPLVLENGKAAVLAGGGRLISALQEAVGEAQGPLKIRITAQGAAGTTARGWVIKRA